MPQIVTIGEILVEVMAQHVGQSFLEPGLWEAPFPSGAPATFASQAAQMGCSSGIVSCVGDDDFGKLNLTRLVRNGVDVSKIRITTERPTGCAFVTYHEDSSRSFIFHIPNAACGLISPDQFDADWLADCQYLHVMGSSLSIPGVADSVLKAAPLVRRNGGRISFDPNIRPELLNENVRAQLADVLQMTDVFLPGEVELPYFAQGASTIDAALDCLFSTTGMSVVVVKQGARGCVYADRERRFFAKSYAATEVDPTGAGDCFAGAFIGALVRHMPADEALALAQAAGASAVSIKGPMEGVSSLDALRTRIMKSC